MWVIVLDLRGSVYIMWLLGVFIVFSVFSV
jgi:hypothetical protein